MPPRAIDHAPAPRTALPKGFLGFLTRAPKASRRWGGHGRPWTTVRALGQTWSSNGGRSARRPVLE